MKKFKRVIGLILAVCMLLSVFSIQTGALQGAKLTLSNLKTEELTNPLGVDTTNPNFSWVIQSSERGTLQTAYQIKVYQESPDGTVVWDTGKVTSPNSINVKYEGDALASSTKYYWQVKVWDNHGNESAFSEPAYFSTGKFDPETELKADWITYNADAGEVDYNPIKIKFDQPITAQYFRFAVQKMGLPSTVGQYRTRIAEIEAYNSQTDPNYENNLLYKKSTSTQNQDNVSKIWNNSYINDGVRDSVKVPAGYQSRYALDPDLQNEKYIDENGDYINNSNGKVKSFNDWVNFKLGSDVTIDEVWIYPALGNEAISDPSKVADFPSSYTVSFTNNDSLYAAKPSLTDSGEDINTQWVIGEQVVDAEAPDNELPTGNSLPLIAKSFNTDSGKQIKSATLYSSGLGIYEMRINGNKVTDNVLEPGLTEYEKSIFYNTYDVTELLNNEGENVIGAMLGNGIYDNPRYALRYSKADRTNGKLKLYAQLEITYEDGSTQTILSDDSWKWTNGPTVLSHWYGGEDYDARLEQPGWDSPGFDYSNWQNCVIENTMLSSSDGSEVPMGAFKSRMYPGSKIVDTHETVNFYHPEENVYVFDLGVNFAGWFELNATLPEGTKLKMLPAEQFNSSTQRVSQASYGETPLYDTYIFKGDENGETWHPNFMYHGFRWLEVTVIGDTDVELTPDMIRGLEIMVSNEQVGEFETSDQDVNAVHDLILRSAENNMYDTYTDCPQREKLGWMEQSHLTYELLSYNYNIAAYMEKIAQDQREGQYEDGLMPSTLPGYSPQGGNYNDDLSWGGAAILVPWYTYETYGDKQILEKSWDAMQKLMQHYNNRRDSYKQGLDEAIAADPSLSYTDFDYVLYDYGLGDWGEYQGDPYGVKVQTQISQSTVLITTPVYAQLAKTMSEIATTLGDTEKAAEYATLYENIKAEFNKLFFNYETGMYKGPVKENNKQQEAFAPLQDFDLQSVYSLALFNDLVPDGYEEMVLQNLVNNIVENDYHLNTGEVTLKYMISVLRENGYNDLVYKMAMNDTMPSYTYFIGRNTSLPEHWNGSGSQSHIMMGHIDQWFYEGIGGINNDGIAFENFTLSPYIPEGMTSANTATTTKYGEIRSNWNYTDGNFNWEVVVPTNTTATIVIPVKDATAVTESGNDILGKDGNGLTFAGIDENGYCTYTVGSGSYHFTATDKAQPSKTILNTVIAYAEEQQADPAFDNVIADVQKSFTAALENAKAVAANTGATQEEVNAAWQTLLNEIHKLGFVKGDITSLQKLVNTASSYDLTKYVEAGQAEFKEALAAAQELLADKDNALANEIETAETNLLNAMLNLRFKADKSVLEQVIAEANSKDATAYTAESYAILTSAVEKATNVLADENATQQDVDTAVESVQTAMDGLVALSGTSVEAPTENNAVDQTTQIGQETTTTKANAAKTGDVAPIAMVVTLATAASALVLLNKKRK